MNIVFLGPPGSGKGTQGKLLAAELGIPHISTGDLLREIASSGTDLGREVADIIGGGDLVSDALLAKVLRAKLESAKHEHGFVLDGTPRNIEQSRLIESFAPIDAAIVVDVPDEVVAARITARMVCPVDHSEYNTVTKPPENGNACDLCGAALEHRSDDTPEGVAHRLSVYHQQTEPVMRFYSMRGKLVRVDGDQPMDAVQQEINKKLSH